MTTSTTSENAAAPQLVSSVPLWQHKDDHELGDQAPDRPHPGGDPAVFPLDPSRVDLTKQWQFFIRAINYNMLPQKVSAIFGDRRAFCNHTGLGDAGNPRADFLTGENLSSPLPQLDKVRTCALSVMTGTVIGTELIVEMMDGSQPPPLKPGRSYPEAVEDIDPDIYEFTPRTHRHLFFAANITKAGGRKITPFPNGEIYDWIGDGRRYTWLPHVAPSQVKVRCPLSHLTQLPPGVPIPSPYKP